MGGGGGKIPYPKHVWSPAGGWYGQPANWKANTAIMSVVIIGFIGLSFKISAELEERPRMPGPDDFCPSRHWSRQIREHEAKLKAQKLASKS
ncbi:MAG: hypothetical protein GOMPHAMPRED_007765 [Gomphillus americanus]|uniref:Uncharacterized protein n=1 Tax=Gomphillus americanus TaxID=1940652 RepID=A0A8H3EYT3_9LECA|nr:MAG: hypothetical protein GOMPHAMPRED_007765 [Gomphillus americanus]